MIDIGDKVILKRNEDDYPMCSNNPDPDHWTKHISCKIVFIGMGDMYKVRNEYGYEYDVHREEFTIDGENIDCSEFPVRSEIIILPADDPDGFFKRRHPKWFKKRHPMLPRQKFWHSFKIFILKKWYKYVLRREWKLGWKIYEEVGIVILNDKHISKINIDK